jgi:hypothetical protein
MLHTPKSPMLERKLPGKPASKDKHKPENAIQWE